MKKILIDVILNASAALKNMGKLGKAFALTEKQAKRLANQRDFLAYQQEANKPAWRSDAYRSRADALKKEAALRMSLAEDLKMKESALSKQYWETRQQYIKKERKLRQNLNAEEAKAARAEAARLNGQMKAIAMQRLNAKKERAAAAAYYKNVYEKQLPAIQRADAMYGGIANRMAGSPPAIAPAAARMQKAGAGVQRGTMMAWGGYANAMMGYYALTSALRQMDPGRKYEFTMKSVEAIAAGGKRQEELRKVVEKIGAETPLTTNEVAMVAEKLAKAGFNSRQMINSLPGLINLSLATGTKPERGADYMAKTLAMYKLQSTQARKVSDYYTQAMLSAPTDMPELFTAMTYAGTSANKMGVSLRDSLAMMMALAKEGLVGSKAGTGLRNALTNIYATRGKPAIGMLDKYKIDRVDKKTGLQIPIEQILKQIAANVPKKDLFKFATQVFGKPGLGAGLILIEAARSGQLKSNQQILDQGAGSDVAARIALQKSDTFEGDIAKMQSAVEGLQIAVFNKLLPQLREATQKITEIVLATMEWVNKNPKLVAQYAELAAKAGGIFVAISALTGVLGTVYASVQGLVWLCSALRFIWASMVGLMGGVAASMLTIVGLAILYAINSESINESLYQWTLSIVESSQGMRDFAECVGMVANWFEYVLELVLDIGWVIAAYGGSMFAPFTGPWKADLERDLPKEIEEFKKIAAGREHFSSDEEYNAYLQKGAIERYTRKATRKYRQRAIDELLTYNKWISRSFNREEAEKVWSPEAFENPYSDPKRAAEVERQQRIDAHTAVKVGERTAYASRTGQKKLEGQAKQEAAKQDAASTKAQNEALNRVARDNQARQQLILQASGFTMEDLHLKPYASAEEFAKAVNRRNNRIYNMTKSGMDVAKIQELLPSNAPDLNAINKLTPEDRALMYGLPGPVDTGAVIDPAVAERLNQLTQQYIKNGEVNLNPNMQQVWEAMKQSQESAERASAQANKVASVDYSQMVASVSSASVAAKGVDVNVAAPSVVVNCDAKSIQGFTDEIMVALGPKIEAAAKSAASQIVMAQANNAARFRTAMA